MSTAAVNRKLTEIQQRVRFIRRHPSGETEGKHPKEVAPDALAELHPPRPILDVVRMKCLDCSAGQWPEVRKCTAISCALWPYRMGSNPYRTRTVTDEQRLQLAEARRRRGNPGRDATLPPAAG